MHNGFVDCVEDGEGVVVFLHWEAEDADGGCPQGLLAVVDLFSMFGDDLVLLDTGFDHHCQVSPEAGNRGFQEVGFG